jgi:acetoin utilization protein AcuB
MTRNPVTVTAETSVTDALRLMREKKVRRFPVLDGHGKLAGIVSEPVKKSALWSAWPCG